MYIIVTIENDVKSNTPTSYPTVQLPHTISHNELCRRNVHVQNGALCDISLMHRGICEIVLSINSTIK